MAEAIGKPESVRVVRTADELRMEWEWHEPGQRRMYLRTALVLPVLLGGLAFAFGMGGLVPLALLVGYGFLAQACNRTSVRLGNGKIRVTHRPLPWPEGRTVRLADIEELYMGTSITDSGDAYSPKGRSFRARALLRRSGKKLTLFGEPISNYDQRVLFVLQELRRELASGRWSRTQT